MHRQLPVGLRGSTEFPQVLQVPGHETPRCENKVLQRRGEEDEAEFLCLVHSPYKRISISTFAFSFCILKCKKVNIKIFIPHRVNISTFVLLFCIFRNKKLKLRFSFVIKYRQQICFCFFVLYFEK